MQSIWTMKRPIWQFPSYQLSSYEKLKTPKWHSLIYMQYTFSYCIFWPVGTVCTPGCPPAQPSVPSPGCPAPRHRQPNIIVTFTSYHLFLFPSLNTAPLIFFQGGGFIFEGSYLFYWVWARSLLGGGGGVLNIKKGDDLDIAICSQK